MLRCMPSVLSTLLHCHCCQIIYRHGSKTLGLTHLSTSHSHRGLCIPECDQHKHILMHFHRHKLVLTMMTLVSPIWNRVQLRVLTSNFVEHMPQVTRRPQYDVDSRQQIPQRAWPPHRSYRFKDCLWMQPHMHMQMTCGIQRFCRPRRHSRPRTVKLLFGI